MKDPRAAHRNDLLSSEELRDVCRIDRRSVRMDIALTWLAMLAVMEAAVLAGTWWAVLAAFVAMGCLQNALITWVHEASHSNLDRNRRANDLLCDLLLAGPAGISVDQYRWHHGAHHKYLGDPEREIELVAWDCLRGANLFMVICRHLLGFYAFQVILRKKRFSSPDSRFPPPPPRSRAAWAGFLAGNLVLFALFALQGAWHLYFVLWVAPLFTLALMISNLRTIVEHQPGSAAVCDQPLSPMAPRTRIVRAGLVERLLVAPVGFYHHYEHHLYPAVPYRNLPKVRKILEQRGHFDLEPPLRSDGYVRTLLRLAFDPGFGASPSAQGRGRAAP